MNGLVNNQGEAGAAGSVPGASKLPGWRLEGVDFPTFRITLLAKVMDRLTIRQLTALDGISYAEWRVLARLGQMPRGGTIGDVAEQAWVDRAEVSRAARALEDKGLVIRYQNPIDLRRPILHMTKLGKATYRKGIASRRAFHLELLADLSPEERRVLDDLLLKVGDRLMAMVSAETDD